MISKLINVLVLTLVIRNINAAASRFIDVDSYASSYYDPKTGSGLRGVLEDNGRLGEPRIIFRGLTCNCQGFTCNCCAGINITALNFNRRTCTNLTYDAIESNLRMAVTMNEREVYANSLSARNLPPMCVPFPYLPLVSFCVRLFDMFISGRNFHTCIDFETRVIGAPILILHFNCVTMGADGISWGRPEDDNHQLSKPEVNETEVGEPEIYDEVDFEQADLEIVYNHTSTLRPEDEAQIGQLKL